MGIPYSREINAAFEQVTPLVAAGFQVLRTTKNISIVLAVIQVLTVVFLGLILGALVVLIYCVNPDLEEERKALVSPLLKRMAHVSLFSVVRTLITSAAVLGGVGYAAWRVFLFEQWVEDVEYEANVDADLALGEWEGDAKDKGKGSGGASGKKKGKAKAKSDTDRILEEEKKKK
ncbi:hypothetical protein ST47_g1575 [Ascochyta rabiei]|uniref:Uncharacterized protein n=2 Tax=Didymella rabiei TaxID=5454 RepID=A0A163KVX7_DIDRA|nr:hypothetical protein ST47_g1575 [Ascochyta rabiei]